MNRHRDIGVTSAIVVAVMLVTAFEPEAGQTLTPALTTQERTVRDGVFTPRPGGAGP